MKRMLNSCLSLLLITPLSFTQTLASNSENHDFVSISSYSPMYKSSHAYVRAQYRTFVGPRAYVRQRINNIDYGGFVPYLYTDNFGMHHYGGLAPMIGANPYSVIVSFE